MSESGSKRIIRAGIGYTAANYMLKGLSFVTIPIFSRLMTPADYGIFNTFASYEGILFVIIGLTLHSCFKNAKYKYQKYFDEFISSCIMLSLVSLFIWLVVGNLLYFAYGDFIGFSRFAVNLLLLNSYANALILDFNAYVGLNYQYKSYFKIAAFNAISSVLLSILLITTFYSDVRYLGRIIGMACPAIIIGIYIIVFFFKKSKPTYRSDYWAFAIRYSLPIVPHGLSQVVLSQFDRIMINHMVGAAQAGIYSFSYNIYALINIVYSSLDPVWSPWFYEQMHAKEFTKIRKISSIYALGIFMFSSLVLLVSPELILILGGKQYSEASYTVVPIVIAGFFSFLYSIPILVEYYYAKTKFVALGTTLAAIVNIILNYIFINLYGYIAAAYTTLVTYALYFSVHYWLAAKVHGHSLFDTKRIIQLCVGIILLGIVTIVLLDIWFLRWAIVTLISIAALVYFIKSRTSINSLLNNRKEEKT